MTATTSGYVDTARAQRPVGRLLTAIEAAPGSSLRDHHLLLGDLPTGPGQARALAEITRSGLLGRGGAGFPVGHKLAAVAGHDGHRSVVGNGAESEPGSRKDAVLLQRVPHLVLDGLAVAAEAAGADSARLVLHRGSPVIPVLTDALRQRRDRVPVTLHELPHRYVASESSALLRHMAGGDARPTVGPHAAGRGCYVGNVETLAHLGLLARRGADWLNAVGEEVEPGTMLVTVTVPGAAPRVTEIELGTPVGAVVEEAGGDGAGAAAILVGGYGGAWWSVQAAWDLPLSHTGMRGAGGALGAGIVMVLGHGCCPLVEIARVARWLDDQSARQCGPCVHGLAAIAAAVSRLAHGRPDPGDEAGLVRWQRLVPGRGACRHPDGALRFVGSGLRVFADHAEWHRSRGACRLTEAPPQLPLPATESGWR